MKHKIEVLNKRLKEVKDKYEALRRCGIPEEILLIYLHHKTHLSMKECKDMIKGIDEFYDKLCKEVILDGLEKG